MSQKPNDHSHEVEIRVNSPSGTRRAKTGTDKRGNRYFERELIKVNDQGIETCRWHLNAGGDGGKQWASVSAVFFWGGVTFRLALAWFPLEPLLVSSESMPL